MAQPAAQQPNGKDHNRAIFDVLPKLGSLEYLKLMRTATAAELPAPVLVMAYCQLPPGEAADATLARLLSSEDKYGYLGMAWATAKRHVKESDYFGVEDLVIDTATLIAERLGTRREDGAAQHWLSFVRQRTIDAYRARAGRRGERTSPPLTFPRDDGGQDEANHPMDGEQAQHAPWHGRVAPDRQQWLEEFIARTIACISEPRIREVAHDLFGADPSPITGAGRDGRPPLDKRFGVDASTIHEWRRIARGRLLAALRRQQECEIDIEWLEEALMRRRGAKRKRSDEP